MNSILNYFYQFLPQLYFQAPDTTATGVVDKATEVNVSFDMLLKKVTNILEAAWKMLPLIGIAIIVLIIFYFLAKLVAALVRNGLKKQGRANFGEILGGFVWWVMMLVGLGVALTTISPNMTFEDLIGGLGISSVAIGFAFKDILQNWMAGILILTRQPFEIGDEIEVNGIQGRVDRIETRATIIYRYDGQEVVIPNSEIYTNSLRVITSNEYIRSQYDVGVGYDQDYEKAIELLRTTLEGIDGINQDKPIDILPWDQADSWLNVRVRWWTKSDRGDVVKTFSQVILKTQQAMNEAGIDLPFPTAVRVKNAHDVAESQKWEEEVKRKMAKDVRLQSNNETGTEEKSTEQKNQKPADSQNKDKK